MEPNSVRFIPNVFEKLLYYVAPADALAYGSAYCMLEPVACRQVRDRLATPKKRMLLLAWPFCMHVREDASNYYKEAEFYEILRTNVIKRSGAVRSRATATDEMMREFLTGFELLMLECVESNICLCNNLKVLMLDFHDHGDDPYGKESCGNSTYLNPFRQSAPYQTMASERWGKVIGAVVARCASGLRHFVFVVGFCTNLPEKFYISLKLDSLLAQTQQLETLYIPSFAAYNVAHSNLRGQRLCWQALHNLPIEQRLPKLRRIVVGSSSRIIRTTFDWDGKLRVLASDAVAIHAAFSTDETMNLWESRGSKAELPQFHHSLTAFKQEQHLLAIEVVYISSADIQYYDAEEKNFMRLLNIDTSAKTNVTGYFRDENKLTLSYALFKILTRYSSNYQNDKFAPNTQQFITDVEESLLKVATYRSQTLSIVNDIAVGGTQTPAKIPAVVYANSLRAMGPKPAALLLGTLSSRLSCPLSLTLQLDWYTLLRHLDLFTMTTTIKRNAPLMPWSRWISRGELKLELKISNSLQSYIHHYRRNNRKELIAQFDEMFLDNILSVDNQFVFPPRVTIEISTPLLVLEYTSDYGHLYKPIIREHYREFLQQFVDDIAAAAAADAGDEPIYGTDTLMAATTRTLRADLYASCRKLVVHVQICCQMPSKFKDSQTNSRHVQRVEKLVYDKQFELELVQLFYNNAKFAKAESDEKETQQFVMPNLKSVSILRKVTASYDKSHKSV